MKNKIFFVLGALGVAAVFVVAGLCVKYMINSAVSAPKTKATTSAPIILSSPDDILEGLRDAKVPSGETKLLYEKDGKYIQLVTGSTGTISVPVTVPAPVVAPTIVTSGVDLFDASRTNFARNFFGPKWAEFFPETENRLTKLEGNITEIGTRIDGVESKMDTGFANLQDQADKDRASTKLEFDNVKGELGKLAVSQAALSTGLSNLSGRQDSLDKGLQKIDSKVDQSAQQVLDAIKQLKAPSAPTAPAPVQPPAINAPPTH